MSNDEFTGFDIPHQNWSKLPHAMIERLPFVSSLAEMKVILYILRHTWGFSEYGKAKRITLDEFQNGRKRKDGSRLDEGIGMSANAIRDGLQRAVEHGFILQTSDGRDKGRNSHEYEIRLRVQELNPTPSEVEPQAVEVAPRSEKDTPERNPRNRASEIEQQNAESTAEFENIFGPGPPIQPLVIGTWQERQAKCPWLAWGDGAVKPRDGVSAEDLQRVGFLLERATGLVPVDGEWPGWLKALRMIYQAGEGDFAQIVRGIGDAWGRERQYRPSHARGFVGPVKKARLEPAQDKLAQQMETDPQFQAFNGE